ncbi:regulator of G-protein signaling 19-like isoform X3 [Syngnathoides biaculeatus]|uniref:regulator of G-protein signaling 19-like isoform X3 n=1 Tax=Syngnathoides biaculeatus TaxID=300417 RepID=UPI002ADE590A|nr:regulator of G-protein signaling 19-like isoform X3 [Syngnathoides biaculeatus]
MWLRLRRGCRPPDLLNAKIYTGPIPAEGEGELAMGVGRGESSPLSEPVGQSLNTTKNSQRPSACCFCWCCCCSCSWNEDERRRRTRKRISQDNKMETIPNCEACTKPSVEEMQLWSQSFDKLMRNPAGRNVFREFLRTEYSEENMLFWLACEDLKQEMNKNIIEEKVRSIYEDYISILSPKEVCVSKVTSISSEQPSHYYMPGKRARGRPKKRLMDVVREDMMTVGVRDQDARDRLRWKKMTRFGDP